MAHCYINSDDERHSRMINSRRQLQQTQSHLRHNHSFPRTANDSAFTFQPHRSQRVVTARSVSHSDQYGEYMSQRIIDPAKRISQSDQHTDYMSPNTDKTLVKKSFQSDKSDRERTKHDANLKNIQGNGEKLNSSVCTCGRDALEQQQRRLQENRRENTGKRRTSLNSDSEVEHRRLQQVRSKPLVRQASLDEGYETEKQSNYQYNSTSSCVRQIKPCRNNTVNNEIVDNEKKVSSRHDSETRAPQYLTRQKTVHMASADIIDTIEGSPTFTHSDRSNNLTAGSGSKPAETASVKRNSTPEYGNNVRPQLLRQKRHSQPTNNQLLGYRLVVLGSAQVGKSALVARYLTGVCPGQYKPTVGDSYNHLVQLPG